MSNNKKKDQNNKSLESWIWDAACAIRGAKDAGKFKDFILPLIFVKRLCDVFDDEVNKIAKNVGSRTEALRRIDADHSRVRFYLSIRAKDMENKDTWSVIRSLSNNIGEELTRIIREIAANNSILDGVIDTVDYNATTRGQREIDDDRLSNLIEAISQKRLGLKDVEPDIIGRSYEYLIRKFAEGSGQTAGEFYTPREVGLIMAYIMDPVPGMEVYDPACGSAGLLIKCELALKEKQERLGKKTFAPLGLYGQEYTTTSWAMAKMNMIIHDMEGDIELGDTFNNPRFKDSKGQGIKKFDRSVANPMWNQPGFKEEIYTNDVFNRFPAGNPGGKADWGWLQHIYSSLKDDGRAAVVLDTGAASRGSGNANTNKEKETRKWFVENDIIEGVLYLSENLFYNTTAPGIIIFLNKKKPAKLKDKIFLINASKEFIKGDPKNYINDEQIKKIADIYNTKKEVDDFSMFVGKDKFVKNDYNILPTRYIHNGNVEEYELIEEIFKSIEVIQSDIEKTKNKVAKVLSNHKDNVADFKQWKTIKIKDLGKVLTGTTPSTKNKKYYGGEFKLISPADLTDSKYIKTAHKLVSKEGLNVSRTVPKNSILVGCIGNIGKIGMTNDEISAFNQQINAIVCNENFDSDFVFYLIKYQKPLLESMAAKVTVPILNKNNFENIEIQVPDIVLQRKISKILNLLNDTIEFSKYESSLYCNLFKTLLHELMSGERRVKY
ncbi:MAG: N-6 DNA methylase [Patescibacteria group bacterium]|nr:N-6 DNA methylase [Patescibacteria group bacterium]